MAIRFSSSFEASIHRELTAVEPDREFLTKLERAHGLRKSVTDGLHNERHDIICAALSLQGDCRLSIARSPQV